MTLYKFFTGAKFNKTNSSFENESLGKKIKYSIVPIL